jgi:hypothetical protein
MDPSIMQSLDNNSTNEVPIGSPRNIRNEIPEYIKIKEDKKKKKIEEFHKSINYVPSIVPNEQNVFNSIVSSDSRRELTISELIDKYIVTDIAYDSDSFHKGNNSSINECILKLRSSYIIFIASKVEHKGVTANDLLYLRAVFHKYIVDYNCTILVPIYNEIFNDNIYAKFKDEIEMVTAGIPTMVTSAFVNSYQRKIRQLEIANRLNKAEPKYAVKEIVGAQDKEGRWWMAQVLEVFSYKKHHLYYVEFVNWGDQFNEFISNHNKLQKYNPKKHKLYKKVIMGRSKSVPNVIEETDEKDEPKENEEPKNKRSVSFMQDGNQGMTSSALLASRGYRSLSVMPDVPVVQDAPVVPDVPVVQVVPDAPTSSNSGYINIAPFRYDNTSNPGYVNTSSFRYV